MAEITSLRDAVTGLVHDGDLVALERFTHLIPHAAGHELIRQQRRHLTAARLTPDVVYDQLIGAGCVDGLIFSWGATPASDRIREMKIRFNEGTAASGRPSIHERRDYLVNEAECLTERMSRTLHGKTPAGC